MIYMNYLDIIWDKALRSPLHMSMYTYHIEVVSSCTRNAPSREPQEISRVVAAVALLTGKEPAQMVTSSGIRRSDIFTYMNGWVFYGINGGNYPIDGSMCGIYLHTVG